ncbi:MAG: GDSL-type esterase/lipase family protein [Bacteroidales bacterium]|nr:GDSL-type esterase/lipase family protein [Bacteroidales bacterium]
MYQELPEVKAWETEIAKFEEFDKTEQYATDAIIFAGSSSIRLWSTLAEDIAPFKVIKRGYGGAKLSDFATYAERIFSPHSCSAVVIFIANDIIGSDKDKSPEEVKRLFLSVLKTIRRSHPDVPVLWIGVTPTSSRWKAWPEISKANDLISEACQNRRNTYFIRTDYAFLNGNGQPRDELFVADKLHLNREGYKLWTQIIKPEIEKVLNK